MSKTILSEVDQLIGNVFRPAYSMFAYSLVLIAITALLFMINPWLAFLAAGLLGGLYALAFLILKLKLTHLGSALVASNKERFMAAGEVFGGIKDIKLLGHEQSYLSRFSGPSQRFASTHAKHHTLNQIPHFLIEAVIFGALLLLTVVLMITAGGLSSTALGQILPILGLYAFSAHRMKPAVHHIYEGLPAFATDTLPLIACIPTCTPKTSQISFPNYYCTDKGQNCIALQNLSYTTHGHQVRTG